MIWVSIAIVMYSTHLIIILQRELHVMLPWKPVLNVTEIIQNSLSSFVISIFQIYISYTHIFSLFSVKLCQISFTTTPSRGQRSCDIYRRWLHSSRYVTGNPGATCCGGDYRISGIFCVGKFWRKWGLEGVLNFHLVLFSLFQGLSMKTYKRDYFSLCFFFCQGGRELSKN